MRQVATMFTLGLLLNLVAADHAGAQAQHPLIERAQLLSDRGEFESARAMLESLPATLALDRDDLISVLFLRASLAYAMNDVEDMQHNLASVARLVSSGELPSSLPPLLREGVEAHARSAVRPQIDASLGNDDVGVLLSIERTSDDALVRGVRVYSRASGSWRALDESGPELHLSPDVDAVYLELIGLGGAPIAHSGSRDQPLVVVQPGAGVEVWPFIVVGVVVLIGAGVLAGWAIAEGESDPQLGMPVIEW